MSGLGAGARGVEIHVRSRACAKARYDCQYTFYPVRTSNTVQMCVGVRLEYAYELR